MQHNIQTIDRVWKYDLILSYLIKLLPTKATAKEAYQLYELYKDKDIKTDYGNFELNNDELLGLCFEAKRLQV